MDWKEIRKKFANLTLQIFFVQVILWFVNKIIKEDDIKSIKNLDVKSMYQVLKNSKTLKNIPINKFAWVLKYKSKWLGKKVIEINKYYPK